MANVIEQTPDGAVKDNRIRTVKQSGTKNGYFVPACKMLRPWIAQIDGTPLTNARGQPARFASSLAAYQAAARYLAVYVV